jgi:hypothetical protein
LFIVILFSAFSRLNAQNKTAFGIGAGINISNVSDNQGFGTSSPLSDKIGFKGYVFADMQLAKYFSIETGLGYDGMEFKVDVPGYGQATNSMNYFTLSVLPKIHIKQSGVAFFGGLSLAFLLSSKLSIGETARILKNIIQSILWGSSV